MSPRVAGNFTSLHQESGYLDQPWKMDIDSRVDVLRQQGRNITITNWSRSAHHLVVRYLSLIPISGWLTLNVPQLNCTYAHYITKPSHCTDTITKKVAYLLQPVHHFCDNHREPTYEDTTMSALQSSNQSQPVTTVYARNLEERIKPPELIEALREIFSEYGTIIDLVAKQNLKAKGQAFIVFDNAESASTAIDEVNGFELFGKPMQLDFARTRSDATVKAQEGETGLEKWKRGRIAEKERKQAAEATKGVKRAAPAVTGAGAGGADAGRPAKTQKGAGLKGTSANAAAVIPDEYLPPNKILFLRDIPDSYDADGLTRIFSRFEGFKELRLVPSRKGIAFVEYEAEAGAISAKEATAGMQLGDEGKGIRVTFQRA